MTKKDGSPEASEGPYWSEELLAVLVVGLGDETQARDTLEGIIQQALSGKALQGLSEETLASYLSKLYERIAESVQDSDVARRRSLTKKVEVVTEAARKAVAAAYTELSEELLEERVAMAEELAQKQRELKAAAWERSDATVRVAASLEQAKEAAEVEKKKASAALEKLKHERPEGNWLDMVAGYCFVHRWQKTDKMSVLPQSWRTGD